MLRSTCRGLVWVSSYVATLIKCGCSPNCAIHKRIWFKKKIRNRPSAVELCVVSISKTRQVPFIEAQTGTSFASLLAGQFPLYYAKSKIHVELAKLIEVVRTECDRDNHVAGIPFSDCTRAVVPASPGDIAGKYIKSMAQFCGLYFTDPDRFLSGLSTNGFSQAVQKRNKVVVKFYSAPKASASEESFEVAVCFPAQDGLHDLEFPRYRKNAGSLGYKKVRIKPEDTLLQRDLKTVIPILVSTTMARTGLYIQGQTSADDSFEQLRYNDKHLVWKKVGIQPEDLEDLIPVRWCENVGEEYTVSLRARLLLCPRWAHCTCG